MPAKKKAAPAAAEAEPAAKAEVDAKASAAPKETLHQMKQRHKQELKVCGDRREGSGASYSISHFLWFMRVGFGESQERERQRW
jgi:hypothetical protein